MLDPDNAEEAGRTPSAPEPPAIDAAAELPEPPVVPAADVVPPVAPPEPVSAIPPTAPSETEPSPVAERPAGPRLLTVVLVAGLLSLIIGAFTGLAGGFLGAHLFTRGGLGQTPPRINVVPPETDQPFIAAAAAALPSVVSLEVRTGAATGGEQGLPENHPDVPMGGSGAGVAYKTADDGGTYVITNNHVIEGAKRLTARTSSGHSFSATVVGSDPESDIAVVKINAKIAPIGLGDSTKLSVGEGVMAIGSPFGLSSSVSTGIVSALGRSLPDFTDSTGGSYPLIDVIQTDAAINPGNSGGALVNRTGKLVGINSAIYSESGASDGVGFAVPVETATRVADLLIKGDVVKHPFIGVVGQSVTPELASAEKLKVEEGAFVAELSEGSGALDAGVQVGDVIVEVAGEPIRSMEDLILQIRRTNVGDRIDVVLDRKGEKVELPVEVRNKPTEAKRRGSEESTTP